MHTRILPSLLLAALTGLSVAAFADTLEISGSTTVQKGVIEPNLGAIKAATGLEVKFAGVGTGKGMIALFEGKVPVAAASESLEEAIASAKKAVAESGKAVSVPADLQFHELKVDSIVVIVNKDNPVDALTKAQLKDINSGKVKNWKEVGGPDLPVKVVTSQPGSATRAVFQKQIMDGAEYVPGVIEVRTTREELNEVSKDKGGIGAVSEDFFGQSPGKSKTVKAPAIKRPLALITVGKPKPEAQKLIDFFKSAEGKKLLK